MSGHGPEASSRPTVKTELTSARCLGLRRPVLWMQTIGAALVAIKQCSPVRMSMPAQGGRSVHRLLYLAAVRRRQRREQEQASRPACHLMLPGPVQARPPTSENSGLPIFVLVAVISCRLPGLAGARGATAIRSATERGGAACPGRDACPTGVLRRRLWLAG